MPWWEIVLVVFGVIAVLFVMTTLDDISSALIKLANVEIERLRREDKIFGEGDRPERNS